jgi:hypothetical protein
MTERVFHLTTIVVNILSEDRYQPASLEQIARDIIYGDCSGEWRITGRLELSPKNVARRLIAQGSDPEFFQLDKDGNDLQETGE